MSSGGCGPAAWKAPTVMMTPIHPMPAITKATSSHCQAQTTRHQVGIRAPTGMLSLIAALSAPPTSAARDRAAARTVRGQGSGRVSPIASAKAVMALSISDCCASAPALSATRASPLTRPRRTGSRPGNHPARMAERPAQVAGGVDLADVFQRVGDGGQPGGARKRVGQVEGRARPGTLSIADAVWRDCAAVAIGRPGRASTAAGRRPGRTAPGRRRGHRGGRHRR